MNSYERAREFAKKYVDPIATKIDEEARFPKEIFDKLGEEGFFKLMIPKEMGGEGGTIKDHSQVCQGLAESCATVGLCYMMHNVALMCILGRGSEELKKKIVGEVINERKFCALAYSELGTGTHFYKPELNIKHVDGGAVLSGKKSMVTSAEYASYYLVLAPSKKEGEIDNWVVPLGSEGLKFEMENWHGMGMRGNASCPMELNDVHLDELYKIGEWGSGLDQVFSIVAPFFILGLASVYSGLGRAISRAAVEHATARKYPDGSSLANIETVQIHLAKIYNRVNAAAALTAHAADKAVRGDADAVVDIIAARIAASEAAIETSIDAMRVGGGKAYNKSGPIERLMRDAYASQIMAPSVDVLTIWLGKLITDQPIP